MYPSDVDESERKERDTHTCVVRRETVQQRRDTVLVRLG